MTDDSYTLRVLNRVHDVPRETWDAMVGSDGSPFMEWTWIDALEETGCVGEGTGWLPATPFVCCGGRGPARRVRRLARKLVAGRAIVRKGNSRRRIRLRLERWADAAHRMGIEYYPKIVVAVPFTPIAGDRVLVAPGHDRAGIVRVFAAAAREWCGRVGASGVHVLFPRDEEASAWEECGYLRRDGFQFHWFRHGDTTYDEYLARLTSKQRNQAKREARGVRDSGIVIETLAPAAHTREVARTMHAFYRSTIRKTRRLGADVPKPFAFF